MKLHEILLLHFSHGSHGIEAFLPLNRSRHSVNTKIVKHPYKYTELIMEWLTILETKRKMKIKANLPQLVPGHI